MLNMGKTIALNYHTNKKSSNMNICLNRKTKYSKFFLINSCKNLKFDVHIQN
jgi:hypothetical protein